MSWTCLVLDGPLSGRIISCPPDPCPDGLVPVGQATRYDSLDLPHVIVALGTVERLKAQVDEIWTRDLTDEHWMAMVRWAESLP